MLCELSYCVRCRVCGLGVVCDVEWLVSGVVGVCACVIMSVCEI